MTNKELIELRDSLNEFERQILDSCAVAISKGRIEYGPWEREDSRNLVTEVLEEFRDAVVYMSAELVRLKNGK